VGLFDDNGIVGDGFGKLDILEYEEVNGPGGRGCGLLQFAARIDGAEKAPISHGADEYQRNAYVAQPSDKDLGLQAFQAQLAEKDEKIHIADCLLLDLVAYVFLLEHIKISDRGFILGLMHLGLRAASSGIYQQSGGCLQGDSAVSALLRGRSPHRSASHILASQLIDPFDQPVKGVSRYPEQPGRAALDAI